MAYNDAFPIVSNFFETALTSQTMESDTTLYVGSTKELPEIIAGRDYIPMVLTNGNDREVVYVKSFTSNSVFVSRGMEGTQARAWPDLTYMYATMTAYGLQQLRINGFSPVLNANGDRPKMTKVGSQSFPFMGVQTILLESTKWYAESAHKQKRRSSLARGNSETTSPYFSGTALWEFYNAGIF